MSAICRGNCFIRIILISMRLRIQANRYFASVSEFSFIKQIGVGSFGTVRLALHIQTNKCYAVKVDLGKNGSESQLLLLEREINLHTGVDHPHIVKLWDTLIQNDTVYMVMELAQNGTLFNYQNKQQRLTQAEAFKFFSQSLSAIKYMHQHDRMHRDIKPENILLDSANNIKICDLGWATDNIHVKRKTFCGTYEYMAPQMVFEKEYNFSIDIWALGILLYELLHAYAPFPAKNLEQMRQKVKLGYYELGTNFSKELKNLIIEILQFQPEKRPSIAKIWAHPWMEKMKKEIKSEIVKIQSQLQGEVSNRAIVDREKGSLMPAKKHKRFDSLANDLCQSKKELLGVMDFGMTVEKLLGQQKKNKLKKKCKTQGEESIQKIFTEPGKGPADSKSKLKKDKQNTSQVKISSQMSKTGLTFKNDGILSGLKMKRIADKLNQLTNKYPAQKKKGRLKTQKQQLF